MTSQPKPGLSDPIEVSDEDVDEVVAICEGDLRAAIRALLVENEFLSRLLAIAQQEMSWGYVRGRPSRAMKEAEQEGGSILQLRGKGEAPAGSEPPSPDAAPAGRGVNRRA